ncbi:MAG: FecR domain-containing protein [Mangrovibacterium sp.]|nr:FecR domain-containing protein [Mangrovibacterium sp.]
MTEETLIKYITGQADAVEAGQVGTWASASEERQKELGRIRNVWILSGLGNEVDQLIKEPEIRRILDKIRIIGKKDPPKTRRLKLLKYAAVLFFVVSISGFLGYLISRSAIPASEYAGIIVPKGERSKVVLPDGSTVQLNGGSQLRFSPGYRSGKRVVFLEGEAFFEVAHDRFHPFVVEAGNLQIEVLGTKFNVSSYPDDETITTYLEEGKVKVCMEGQGDTYLKPSEVLKFNKPDGTAEKQTVNDHRFSDWTKGILNIKGETIEELARKLERRFDVRISFGDAEVRKHTYSGLIRDEELGTVLEALQFTSSLKYERHGKIVTICSVK